MHHGGRAAQQRFQLAALGTRIVDLGGDRERIFGLHFDRDGAERLFLDRLGRTG